MTALCLGIVLLLATDPIEPRADDFAKAVQQIHETIQARSIVRPSPRLLTELSLRGLYKTHGHDLPDDLAKRLKDEKATTAELRAMLRDGYRGLAKCRELDVEAAIEDAINFTLAALDPHASWKPSGPFVCDFGFRVGIGVQLRLDVKTGMPVVVTPIKDSPAYRAGVRAGDIITHITPLRDAAPNNDIEEEPKATVGAGLPQVVRWIHGPNDSKVILTIQREGIKQPLRMQMTRGPVKIDTVHGWQRKDDDSWDFRCDREKKIGYLRITLFGNDTPKELSNALDELESQSVRRLILDLRFCEGGTLNSMNRAVGQFLDKGDLAFKIQYRKEEGDDYVCKEAKRRPGLKVACLVNGETTSAAELFAAALQDHHRAVIVGERTSGNGSVQNIEHLKGDELCLTAGIFFRPNGKKLDRIRLPNRSADEWGVTPDAGNVVRLEPKEHDALKEYLDRRAIIPRRDVPLKEPPTFKDWQLQRALEVFTSK